MFFMTAMVMGRGRSVGVPIGALSKKNPNWLYQKRPTLPAGPEGKEKPARWLEHRAGFLADQKIGFDSLISVSGGTAGVKVI
jgi:hypothetical protein